jgi:hypothetical protein
MNKAQNPVLLSFIRHRQNPLEPALFGLVLEQKLKSLGAVSINLFFILVISYVLGRETYRNCIRGKVDMLSCNIN